MEWYWNLETPAWEARIRRLAEPIFAAEPAVVELAIEHARQRLLEQARAGALARHNDAYLLTLLKHILIDYSKARYGYRRPPVWVQRLGRIWEAVYHLLCVLKRAPEEITVDMVKARQQRLAPADAETEADTAALIQDAIRAILRQERDCQQPKAPALISLETDTRGDAATPRPEIGQPTSEIEQVLAREDLDHLLETLRLSVLSDEEAEPDASAPQSPSVHMLANLEAFATWVRLTDQERLLLRLIYQEGLSTRAAARHLGQPERQVQRHKRRALRKIAEALTRAGLEDPLTDLALA